MRYDFDSALFVHLNLIAICDITLLHYHSPHPPPFSPPAADSFDTLVTMLIPPFYLWHETRSSQVINNGVYLYTICAITAAVLRLLLSM